MQNGKSNENADSEKFSRILFLGFALLAAQTQQYGQINLFKNGILLMKCDENISTKSLIRNSVKSTILIDRSSFNSSEETKTFLYNKIFAVNFWL